jgi:hypothetical protein
MESGTRAGPAFLRQQASAITRTQLAGDAARVFAKSPGER